MTEKEQIEALTKERDEYAKSADTQAMAHKVERDALAANHKECVRCLGEALQDRADLAAAAKLALDALNLFKSSVDMYHKNGPDWTHKDGTEVFEVGVLIDHQDDIDAAINAIKSAGVQ